MFSKLKSVVEFEKGLECRPANSAYTFWARYAERYVLQGNLLENAVTIFIGGVDKGIT